MRISFGSARVFELMGPTSAKEIEAWGLLARGKYRQADRLFNEVIAADPTRAEGIEPHRMLAECQANDMKAVLRAKPKQLPQRQLRTLHDQDAENCALLSAGADSQSESGESVESVDKPVYERETAGLRHRAVGEKKYVELVDLSQ